MRVLTHVDACTHAWAYTVEVPSPNCEQEEHRSGNQEMGGLVAALLLSFVIDLTKSLTFPSPASSSVKTGVVLTPSQGYFRSPF